MSNTSEAYVMADVKTGWVAGFDSEGEPVFESKGALKHHTTTQTEWLFNVMVAAAKAGISRIEFVRGGEVIEVKTVKELSEEFRNTMKN